jgi:hypothetical protein
MLLAAIHAACCQESAFLPRPAAGDWPSGLRVIAGRPSLFLGQRQVTAAYSETNAYGMDKRNLQMARAGVECFVLIARPGIIKDYHTTHFWRDDGVYGDESDRTDDISLDHQAEVILRERPDAVFMVRWGSEVPAGWAAKHPDELQASETKRRREASYASALAAEGRAEMARRLVRFVEGRPWGARVIGYLPFGQDEGTPTLHIEDCLFDQSPAMTRKLRAYLAGKYGADAALQAAWQDPTVTLVTATQPSDSQWQAARAGWQHWPDPKLLRRYQDYFLTVRQCLLWQRQIELSAVRQAAGRPVLTATDAFKQPMFGWLIQDAFFARQRGMDYRNLMLASGSIGVAEMLDHASLDALITPADYSARSVGFGWDSEGLKPS